MAFVLALVDGKIVEVEVKGGSAAVPTLIASADTFTVPANSQSLYAETIDVEGILDLDGVLVEVN